MNNGKIRTIDGNSKKGTIQPQQNVEGFPTDQPIPWKDDKGQQKGLKQYDDVRFWTVKDENGKVKYATNLNETN